jgi:VWFA-related protein
MMASRAGAALLEIFQSSGRCAFVLAMMAIVGTVLAGQERPLQTPPDSEFRFKSGVELINISAMVFDASGRFVPGLQKDDFVVSEDGERQSVTHFSAERVPVSLGIVLDTSGSMAGEKMRAAQRALDRLLYDLLDARDEIFLYRFSDRPSLVQGWTTDRQLLGRALGGMAVIGSTAMYDAVAEAVRFAATGQHRKKAIVIVSDGNDTASKTSLRDLKQLIRESEALVYAIGIDCGANPTSQLGPSPHAQRRRGPIQIPRPFPPGGRRGRPLPPPPPRTFPPPPQGRSWSGGCRDPVDPGALRDLTNDSGGRTEVVRSPLDLDLATASVADELTKQYQLGYLSPGKKDGRWHSIQVEVPSGSYRVRARRGYVAS